MSAQTSIAAFLLLATGQFISAAAVAQQPSPLPPLPVPMHLGEVTIPHSPDFSASSWQFRGDWLDADTVACGVLDLDVVVISHLDGTVVEVVSNPDGPRAPHCQFGAAVAYVDGRLLVVSARDPYTGPPVLYVLERPAPDQPFQSIARVPLPGGVWNVSDGPTMRIVVENVPGTLDTRKLMVTWVAQSTANVVVLTPTSPLHWDVQIGQIGAVALNTAIVGSVRGNLVAVRYSNPPSNFRIRALRLGAAGQLVYAGEWIPASPYLTTSLSCPAVLDDHTIAVGNPLWLEVGGVHVLRDTGGPWTIAQTILADPILLGSGWGRGLCAMGNQLVVLRAKAPVGGSLGNIIRRGSDGTLLSGATLSDPALLSTSTFPNPGLVQARVLWDGSIVAESAGKASYPPSGTEVFAWNFARLDSGLDLDRDSINDMDAIAAGMAADCNQNRVPDAADIALGLAADANSNSVPDACEADCNGDGSTDFTELLAGAADCDGNFVPDPCQLAAGGWDSNNDGILDACGQDCNSNGILDSVELRQGLLTDCNDNGVADTCDEYKPALLGAPQTAGNRLFLWFPLQTGLETLYTIRASLKPATSPLAVMIVADRSGVADRTIVTAQDVRFDMIGAMPQIPPAGTDGVYPPVTLNLGAVDLLGVPAIWIHVENLQVRQCGWTQGPASPGSALTVALESPNADAAEIAARLKQGVYEHTRSAAVWLSPFSCHSVADINIDGRVDGADLGMLLGAWGCVQCQAADLDHNGVVAGGDLGILLGEWAP